jgi:hypothetical protein
VATDPDPDPHFDFDQPTQPDAPSQLDWAANIQRPKNCRA